MSNWIKITEVNNWQDANKIAIFLNDNEIETSTIDKTDSSYGGIFGKIEIYCQSDKSVEAIHLIQKNNI